MKVYSNDWPGFSTPLFHTPVSLVLVCCSSSIFVQRTVVPVDIVTFDGWNTSCDIMYTFTTLPPGVPVGCGVPVPPGVPVAPGVPVVVDAGVPPATVTEPVKLDRVSSYAKYPELQKV